jgi:hypothetical protein
VSRVNPSVLNEELEVCHFKRPEIHGIKSSSCRTLSSSPNILRAQCQGAPDSLAVMWQHWREYLLLPSPTFESLLLQWFSYLSQVVPSGVSHASLNRSYPYKPPHMSRTSREL